MTEREIILDLSRKIKFKDNFYVSIGTLLLSSLILIFQGFCFGWTWGLFLHFIYSIRSGEFENGKNQ